MFDEKLVLGIDPGIAHLGLAVVSGRDRRFVLEHAETIVTSSESGDAERLARVAEATRLAIDRYSPGSVAIERVAWNRNQVSALTVARATGAVMATAAQAGVEVSEYGPNEVKMAVAGAGNADKKQVRRALERVHGLRAVPTQADAADAVAVAVTHLLAAKLRRLTRTAR
jgi:crossover junction endodeoxyribonuclease RuvC